MGQGSASGRRSHGGTLLYDGVFLAADELMSKQKGRKALVLLTDGEDRHSKERITDAIEAAQRADTIIYAIYFKGEEHRDNISNGGNRGGGFPRGGGRLSRRGRRVSGRRRKARWGESRW